MDSAVTNQMEEMVLLQSVALLKTIDAYTATTGRMNGAIAQAREDVRCVCIYALIETSGVKTDDEKTLQTLMEYYGINPR